MFDFSEINKNSYNQIAGINDTIFDTSEPLSNKVSMALEEFIKNLKIEGNKILNVGCGTGDFDIYLANSGYNVTGMDFSENMTVTCRNKLRIYKESIEKRNRLITNPGFIRDNNTKLNSILSNVNPKIKFITDDISDMNEISEQYNIIIMINTLPFIPENKIERVMENVSKRLYKNGVFIVFHFTEAYYNQLKLINSTGKLFDYSLNYSRLEENKEIAKTELKILRSDMVNLPFKLEFYEKIYQPAFLCDIAKKNNLNIIKISPDVPVAVINENDLNEIFSRINLSFTSDTPVNRVIITFMKK